MSNARLDEVFDRTRQNMIEEYGEDAVNRATQYLKDHGYLWWDYWNYDVSGQSNLSPSDYDEIGRILTTKSTKKSKPATKSFNDMVKKQRNKNIRKGEYYSDFSESDIEDMSLMFQFIEDMAKDCKRRGRGENKIIRLTSQKKPDVFYDEVREVYEKMKKINDDYVEYWHN